jgi:hypothetical protein
MAIWSIKSSLRLQVLSYRQSTGDAFLEEMRVVGIPFAVCSNEKGLLLKMQKDMPLLLLEPAYGEAYTKEFSKMLADKDEPVFILSSDLRWKDLAQKDICYYLPADTHPLELARLLVEKLNLPAVSNKPAYAFSFFQF